MELELSAARLPRSRSRLGEYPFRRRADFGTVFDVCKLELCANRIDGCDIRRFVEMVGWHCVGIHKLGHRGAK